MRCKTERGGAHRKRIKTEREELKRNGMSKDGTGSVKTEGDGLRLNE